MRLPDEGLGVKGASGFASSVRGRFHPRSSPLARPAELPFPPSLFPQSLPRQRRMLTERAETRLRRPASESAARRKEAAVSAEGTVKPRAM